MSDAKQKAATTARTEPPTTDEEAAQDEEATARAAPTESSEPKRGFGYRNRKPVALAVALLAAFGTAIIVGMLAGGPVRQAGTGYNFTPSQTATRLPASTRPAVSSGSPAPTTDPSASASSSPPGSPGATNSGGSAAANAPVASQGATGLH